MKFGNTLIILACFFLLAGLVTAEETAASGDGIVAHEGTDCSSMFNLQETNHMSIPGPTVVDINEATGNLLVRGPMPLKIRDGSGNRDGCRDKADWEFAYDGINEVLGHDKDFVPDYMKGSSKGTRLTAQLQNFNLGDYKVIDISLLNTGAGNAQLFEVENRSFGGQYAMCSAGIPEGTLHGQPAGLVWSSIISCPLNQPECLQKRLHEDTEGFCSYANLITEINSLMNTKNEKKLLIYYHCRHGSDRTGGVTIGYLTTNFPSVSMADAILLDKFLGEEKFNPARIASENQWATDEQNTGLARLYCNETTNNNPKCWAPEPTRINLPGSETHSHLPGQDVAPVVTYIPAPVPTITHAPVQTPVPAVRYNPATSGNANF